MQAMASKAHQKNFIAFAIAAKLVLLHPPCHENLPQGVLTLMTSFALEGADQRQTPLLMAHQNRV
jgi:hypothetical protein